MKRTRLDPDTVFYRFLSPRWSHLPMSGAGAAQNGGRFNRPGVEALYLSADVETALAEYAQGSSITPPGMLVAYRVAVSDIVDFSAGYGPPSWPPIFAGWACNWKAIARLDGGNPPSWQIADELIGAGRPGMLFPSTRRAGGIKPRPVPGEPEGAGPHCRAGPDQRPAAKSKVLGVMPPLGAGERGGGRRVLRPGMLRVSAAHLRPHVAPASLPEAGQVAGELERPAGR